MEKLVNFFNWLKALPLWLRAVVLLLVASLALCLTLTSCGPTVHVSVKGTKDGVNISTTQTSSDSTSLNISVNPHINLQSSK